jgi:3-methylcrotonyl-CoA carboxylase alpha subunit
MLSSVLIANRGEIACRIARTAKRLGLRTIAVYSEADAGALHVRQCDEAYSIGPAPARESYLSIANIIAVARKVGAACIHPGYGFLAENADFATACADAGVVFVGPPPAAIRAMGLKDRAKTLMEKAGVPVVPGFHGERQDAKFLREKAYEIGYPVLIKPVAGGGGKGMRRIDKHAEFEAGLESAVREASAAFGDPRVLIEKFIASPRHIEVQIFADTHGNVIHLNERDCSLQRRHQKVVEEAPAPSMTADRRAAMGTAAVAAAKAVDYVGAGTVEFIVDAARAGKDGGFWFMEMNTRLQVEHPVTEAVTGIDLVEWQFRIAGGEPLPLAQCDVAIDGHAIEARVYAEDPERGFLPSTGKLVALTLPAGEGIRVDTGIEAGCEVTPYYDPMIAKIIAHGKSRSDALERLSAAVERTVVAGPRSNIAFLGALCGAPEVVRGEYDTGFIERNLDILGAAPRDIDRAAAARGALTLAMRPAAAMLADAEENEADSPWAAADGFQLSGERSISVPVVVDGAAAEATVRFREGGMTASIDEVDAAADAMEIETADEVFVLRSGRQTRVRLQNAAAGDAHHLVQDGVVAAPMHGKVLAVLVAAGAAVIKGQRVAVIEAMKMEHTLVAPCDGVVAEVAVAADSQVAEGARILVIEAAPPRSE